MHVETISPFSFNNLGLCISMYRDVLLKDSYLICLLDPRFHDINKLDVFNEATKKK